MPPTIPDYTWPRVKAAIAAWVEHATGLPSSAPAGSLAQVTWSFYDLGSLPKPYISLQRITGRSLGFASKYTREVALSQRITVTQTTVGEAVGVWLIWSETRVLVELGDSLADTRDRLLAALQATVADTREPLVFAADGADSVLVTPRPGYIVDTLALIGCTLADVSTAPADVDSVSKRYAIRIQLYGFSDVADADESIEAYEEALLRSLHNNRAGGGIQFLAQYGVGPEGAPETATDISAISGALHERRSFFISNFVTRSTAYVFGSASIDAIDPPVIEGFFG